MPRPSTAPLVVEQIEGLNRLAAVPAGPCVTELSCQLSELPSAHRYVMATHIAALMFTEKITLFTSNLQSAKSSWHL